MSNDDIRDDEPRDSGTPDANHPEPAGNQEPGNQEPAASTPDSEPAETPPAGESAHTEVLPPVVPGWPAEGGAPAGQWTFGDHDTLGRSTAKPTRKTAGGMVAGVAALSLLLGAAAGGLTGYLAA